MIFGVGHPSAITAAYNESYIDLSTGLAYRQSINPDGAVWLVTSKVTNLLSSLAKESTLSTISSVANLINDIRRTSIDATVDGDNELVAAVSGNKIRVVSLFLTVDNETTIRFESGTAGNFLSGEMTLYAKQGDAADPGATNGQINLGVNIGGHMETVAGESLNLIKSGGDVAGLLSYIEVE